MVRGKVATCVALIVLAALVAACSTAASVAPASAPSQPLASASQPATPSPVPTVPAPTTVAAPSASAEPTGKPSPANPVPSLDPAMVSAYLTGGITIVNLRDDDLTVTVTFLDPTSGQSSSLGSYTLTSLARQSNGLPPGRYRLEFVEAGASAGGASCTITVKAKEHFSFAAVSGAVAVARTGFTPAAARDLFVATSSLCSG